MNGIHSQYIRHAAKLRRWQIAHWRLAIFASMTLLLACARDKSMTGPENIITQSDAQSDRIVYFNSFEASQDTMGWQGYGARQFAKEAPNGGGLQSLQVSGGCVIPHACLVLPPLKKDGHFIIHCWGKDLLIGGGVELNVEGDDTQTGLWLQINQPDWTFYQSTDTLYCPANHQLKLSLASGGIVASAMLVDLIEIIKVK